ncbi:putative fimbriae; chaperone [Klebsiella pneumoniae]|nr:putative fimbriae; chaperone [Klebsiella pneumoniae]
MMSLWDALRMNMMISYQELVRTFLNGTVTVTVVNDQGARISERYHVAEG